MPWIARTTRSAWAPRTTSRRRRPRLPQQHLQDPADRAGRGRGRDVDHLRADPSRQRRPGGRRRRHQARDLQRAQLLPHHRRASRIAAHRPRLHVLRRPRGQPDHCQHLQNPNGPRGAAGAGTDDLERQRAKSVNAINKLGADIVSLEEIENRRQFGKDRDDARRNLVDRAQHRRGLRPLGVRPVAGRGRAAGPGASRTSSAPASSTSRPRRPVGESKILRGAAAFANAREPLAQAFKAKNGAATPTRSASSSTTSSPRAPAPTTAPGRATPTRTAINQAKALVTFANRSRPPGHRASCSWSATSTPTAQEDPIQVLDGAGYTQPRVGHRRGEETYSFGGLSGSLDHVLGQRGRAADGHRRRHLGHQRQRVGRLPVQPLQLQRRPTSVTRRSRSRVRPQPGDRRHRRRPQPPTRDVQILGTNDFHGRILDDTNNDGRCRGARRCGEAAARAEPRTRCSPRPVT